MKLGMFVFHDEKATFRIINMVVYCKSIFLIPRNALVFHKYFLKNTDL